MVQLRPSCTTTSRPNAAAGDGAIVCYPVTRTESLSRVTYLSRVIPTSEAPDRMALVWLALVTGGLSLRVRVVRVIDFCNRNWSMPSSSSVPKSLGLLGVVSFHEWSSYQR